MRSTSIVATIILAAGIGCGSSPPPTTGPAQMGQATSRGDVASVGAGEDEDESTDQLAEHHRHHHHGGLAMFVAMSLDSIGATPEQHDALAKIQADLHASLQPAHDAEKAALLVLADQVAAGQVDDAKLEPAIAQLSTVSASAHEAVAESLNALYKLLTPPQRQALVDKVQAHFEVWHHANSLAATSQKDAPGGHLARMAQPLGLSGDQMDKIHATCGDLFSKREHPDRSKADAHVKAFAAAFTSDHFDAKALDTGGAVNAGMATWGITRLVVFYKAAAPVFTAEQRTKAADELRQHANYKRTDNEP